MSTFANASVIGDGAGTTIPRRSAPMPDIDKFQQGIDLLFPDSASARLSRAHGVAVRNAQKWINGAEVPPDHVVEFVERQVAVLKDLKPAPYETLQAMVDGMIKAGLHEEVVAGLLSRLYDNLTGKSIR